MTGISCEEQSFLLPSVSCNRVLIVVRYKVLSNIGKGSFSYVFKCQELTTGTLYACKRLKKIYHSPQQMNDIPEIIALKKLGHHANVLHLIETIYDSNPGYVIMVFELCDTSLYDFMKKRKRCVPENQARGYIYQLLRGLEFIHRNGIVHRDIKPENVLLKGNNVKIADLGSVREVKSHPPYTEYVSTRWYRSPECLLTTGYYGPKMDIWSAGCVFYELLTLQPLFPGDSELDQITKIHSIIGIPSPRTLEKFRKVKSSNYEWASSWGKAKNDTTNHNDSCGYGIRINKYYATSTSLPSFHKYDQGSLGYFKLFSMLCRLSETGRDVLKQMLMYDPDLRSSARRVLEHRYFNIQRENEISPWKYHCCSEIEFTGIRVSDSHSNGGGKNTLQKNFIPKPPVIGDVKKLHKRNHANNATERGRLNNQCHLPMLPTKYIEKHIPSYSNCKGMEVDDQISGSPNITTRKLTLPKIDNPEKGIEKCHDCKKFKTSQVLHAANKARQDLNEQKLIKSPHQSKFVGLNCIPLRKGNALSSRQNGQHQTSYKKLAQVGKSGLGPIVATKKPRIISKL